MEGQYIIDSKNAYVSKLLNNKKINEAGRVLKTKTFSPIFAPIEIHPESSPNIENDINLPLDEIANDLKILDDQISISAFNIRNYINSTVERLNYSKRLLIEEMQRKQDAEILCKKYDSFGQVIDLSSKEFTGSFHCDNNIFSAEIINHSKVDYTIVDIDGNGYEGNKYVLTSDNKFLQNYMDTSNRDHINDKNNTTLYEYSRITINDSEERYCEDANKDTIEAKCVLTIHSDEPINCIRLLSENKQLKLNQILISEDGISFNEVYKTSIDINNINNTIEINNYIPRSGLICFPSTSYLRLSLESCEYTGDVLGFYATGVEDEFEDEIKKIKKDLKQINKKHVFRFKLKDDTDVDTINKNNVCITDLTKNREVDSVLEYDKSTKILLVKSRKDFKPGRQYELSIQNLKSKSGQSTKDNFRIYFTIKDDDIIYFEPKYFINPNQEIKINLQDLHLNESSIDGENIYILNRLNETIEADFKFDYMTNTVSFTPKKPYSLNSEYRFFISRNTLNSTREPLGKTYCMKFKTQENEIEYKKDIMMAPINAWVSNNIGFDINLNKSKVYIINRNNEIIKANIQNSEDDINEIKINTSSFKLDEEYYCIIDSGAISNANEKSNKQLVFKIITDTSEKLYLDDSMFIDTNQELMIKINYTIDKSYVNLEYIYVLDRNFNKINRCQISFDQDNQIITIKPPIEKYTPNSYYYIVINKNTLTNSLRPIGKTIIKRFKTKNKVSFTKEDRDFLDVKQDIVIDIKDLENISEYYLIDENNIKQELNLEKTKNSIIIKKPNSNFKYDAAYKFIIESNNNDYIYLLKTEARIQDVTMLASKYDMPTNYKFEIKLNGYVDEESAKNNISLLDRHNNKIDMDCQIINNKITIGGKDVLEENSKYTIVLDKNLIVNGIKLNRYFIYRFTTAKKYKHIVNKNLRCNEPIVIDLYNAKKEDIQITNTSHDLIEFESKTEQGSLILIPKKYDLGDKYFVSINDTCIIYTIKEDK